MYAEVIRDVVLEIAESKQTSKGKTLGVIDAPPQRRRAAFYVLEHVVCVFTTLGPRDAITSLLPEATREFLSERMTRGVRVGGDDDARHGI